MYTPSIKNAVSHILSVFKYLVGIFMMYSGVATVADPISSTTNVGNILASEPALLVTGMVFFLCGTWLVTAKATQDHTQVGHSLFAVYLCFVYAAILNYLLVGLDDAVPNIIGAGIMGLLYLRWKHHLFYADSVDKRRHLR